MLQNFSAKERKKHCCRKDTATHGQFFAVKGQKIAIGGQKNRLPHGSRPAKFHQCCALLSALNLEGEAFDAVLRDVGSCTGFEDEHIAESGSCGLAELTAFFLTGDGNYPDVGVLGGFVGCYDGIHNFDV